MADQVSPDTIIEETENGDVGDVRVIAALAYIRRLDNDGMVREKTVMHGNRATNICRSEIKRLREINAVIEVTLDDDGNELPHVSEVEFGVPNVVLHDPDSPGVRDPGAVHPDSNIDADADLVDDDEEEDGLDQHTKAQLEDLAAAEGIEDVSVSMVKSDMIEAIRKARREG